MKSFVCLVFAASVASAELPPSPFWPTTPKDPLASSETEPEPEIEGRPAAARVDVWVFDDDTPALELGGLTDEALFARFRDHSAGPSSAKLVAHHRCSTDGRRVKSEAIHEEMYPTEFRPESPAAMIPEAFETRNAGVSASVLPAWIGGQLRIKVGAESVTRAGEMLWPGSGPAALAQPEFLTQGCESAISAAPGKIALVSAHPVAVSAREWAAPARTLTTRYVFARANPMGDPPPSSPPPRSASFRLTLATFRLSLASAATWLWQRQADDDAAALAELTEAATHGEARLVAVTTLSGATGPLGPDGPPDAAATALTEVIHPTLYEKGAASSFDTLVTGRSLTVRTVTSADGGRLLCQFESGDLRTTAIRRWPLGSAGDDRCVAAAQFSDHHWESQCAIPANGTAFLGLQPVATSAEVDALFVTAKTSQGPAPSNRPVPSTRRVDTFVLSLGESDAQALTSNGTGPDAADAAWALAGRAQARIVFTASVSVCAGASAETSAMARLPFPQARNAPERIAIEQATAGAKLSIRPSGGELRWETAPPQVPAGPVSSLPVGARVRTFEKAESFAVAEPGARIVGVSPSGAPAGSPEHGRWHAVIVRVADE